MRKEDLMEMLGMPNRKVEYSPALSDQVEWMIAAALAEPITVGDIVMLNVNVPADKFQTIKHGQELIVTQAFPAKHDLSDLTSNNAARPVDIAIAIDVTSSCGCDDPDCANKNVREVVEFLHDSREFVKVGRLSMMGN